MCKRHWFTSWTMGGKVKSFSEVLEEEPWTKAKEAAALEEMRKKMEAKHVQKEAENEDEGNEKEGKSNEEKKAKDNSKSNNNNENNVGNNNNSGEEGEQAEKKKTRKTKWTKVIFKGTSTKHKIQQQ